MKNFYSCEYSIDELNEFRDENGFIDLDKAKIEFTKESREIVGNIHRNKNWVNFNGTKALIKGEPTNKEKDYEIYGELIVEEICNQLGIETAHYDLIKYLNDDEELCYGVLSETMLDINKNESLMSLHDLIGDEKQRKSNYMTDYEFTVEGLENRLRKDGYSDKMINDTILDYKKRLAFSIAVLDEDKHMENISFITGFDDKGNKHIRISPNYDSEVSLMMGTDIYTVEEYLADYALLKSGVDSVDPKIGLVKDINEGGFDSPWKDTLEELCEDDEVYDYYYDILKDSVDMDIVIENVEERIHAKLPEQVKLLAKASYNIRNNEMEKLMSGEMEVEEASFGFNDILSSLIEQSTSKAKIRENEQLQIGRHMERDIEFNTSILLANRYNDIFTER